MSCSFFSFFFFNPVYVLSTNYDPVENWRFRTGWRHVALSTRECYSRVHFDSLAGFDPRKRCVAVNYVTRSPISVIPEMWGMITWVMVGLLLAAETCGRNVLSGNGNGKEESKQKDGLKGVTTEEEDIYRAYWRGFATCYEEQRRKVVEKGRRTGQTDLWFARLTRAYPLPFESCNRAPLILLPGFLPLTDLALATLPPPCYLLPIPHKSFPDLYTWLVTYCSEISPTLPAAKLLKAPMLF